MCFFFSENEENVAPNDDTEQLMLAMKGHHDPILEQLLKQMAAMQTQLGNMTNKKSYTTKATNKENTAPMDNINPKTGQPWRRYCWSCGCCPHWSKYCPEKKKGHKMEATFKNRMNGSNTNCLWFFRGATQVRRIKNNLVRCLLNNLSSNVVTSTCSDVLKADSGASKTYIKEQHRIYLRDQVILKNGPKATLPNNQTIQATISGTIPLHSTLNHQTLLFPELQSESLLSIGKLCDEGNIAIFDRKHLKVYK